MSLELRKQGVVVDAARAPRRERARQTLIAVRMRATVVSRRHAWIVWRVGRQLPATACLLVAYTPRGAGRLALRWARWVRDEDTAALRAHHADARETADYLQVAAARRSHLRGRGGLSALLTLGGCGLVLAWTAPRVLAVCAALAAAAAVIRAVPRRDGGALLGAAGAGAGAYLVTPAAAGLVPAPPLWVWAAVTLAGVVGLGWAGRPLARPLVTLPGAGAGSWGGPPLTAPMVTAALCALGNGKMRVPDDVRLLTDPHRHGPGVQIDLELPPGVPATSIMESREELAAALRRELGTVWPSVGPRHPGHLELYVADQPMSQARQAPWPLLRAGQVDLFRPVPVATDQMGVWVEVTLAYANGVIGAVPRMGKTFLLRELLLIAGLDPRARVYAIDGKGTGDLAPCAAFAHYVGVGDEPEDIYEQLDAMRDLRQEMRRRAKVIRGLPREECPESKVTSALADRRDLGLEPVVVGVDETQVWFGYGERANKDHRAIREEFAAIVTDLVKRGPALGIWVFLATQQVNAETIPTSISNNAVLRFCLKVFGQVANDQVLGTGARKAGVDATMFSFTDKGVGYLLADGADPRIVRTVVGLDAVAAEVVAGRARAIRAAAGRLTGAAADEAPCMPVLDVVADVEQLLADRTRESAHLVELVEWLRELRRDYAELDVAELGKRLRNAGADVRPVKVAGRTTSGVRGVDLRERGGRRTPDPSNLKPR